jgi:rSAM/selenodomain-associated transferase 2
VNVSLIIPALNAGTRIGVSVQRAWEAGASEVFVADGGSTDDTAQVASAANCHYLSTQRGRAVQQNAAAAQATGDVLLFLHADNWLPAGAVSQIEDSLANPCAQFGAFRQQIEAPGLGFRVLERGNAWRVRWLGLPYGDQGIFVRRERFLNCGGFPPVPFMEDLLLAKRLRNISWPQLAAGPLHVDARRWLRHGMIRQTIRNWMLLSAYKLGVSPDRLARFYSASM